jgi:hypothetical protein
MPGVRTLAAVTVASAIGVVAGVRLARPAPTAQVVAPAHIDDARVLSDLDGRIDALGDSVSRIDDRTRHASPALAAPAVDESEPAEQPEAALTDDEMIATIAYELGARFADDTHDPEWSAKAEYEVIDLVDTMPTEGNELLSADCQSTMCRVEVSHTDPFARDDLLSYVPGQPPFDTQVFFHPGEPDGDRIVTVFYVARDGYPLNRDEPL